MRSVLLSALVVFGLLPVLWGCQQSQETASTELYDADGEKVGAAKFTETENGLKAEVVVSNLPPGEYAFQIHDSGRCGPPDFMAAGEPFPGPEEIAKVRNPAPTFSQALGTVTISENGQTYSEVLAPEVTLGQGVNSLFHEGGTSLVIHTANPEDKRVACGVISPGSDGFPEDFDPGDLESGKTPGNVGTPGKIYNPPAGTRDPRP